MSKQSRNSKGFSETSSSKYSYGKNENKSNENYNEDVSEVSYSF